MTIIKIYIIKLKQVNIFLNVNGVLSINKSLDVTGFSNLRYNIM
jgi:hypothetical protein